MNQCFIKPGKDFRKPSVLNTSRTYHKLCLWCSLLHLQLCYLMFKQLTQSNADVSVQGLQNAVLVPRYDIKEKQTYQSDTDIHFKITITIFTCSKWIYIRGLVFIIIFFTHSVTSQKTRFLSSHKKVPQKLITVKLCNETTCFCCISNYGLVFP